MGHGIVFILLFTLSIFGFAQTQELTFENQNDVILKDSLGNFLTYKQALELLRTGKYVSVPTINHRMEVETVIRRPRKEDKGKYQSFTDGNTVFSTTGLQNEVPKFNLGDTIPPVKVIDKHGQRLTLTNNSTQTRNTLLVFIKETDATWRDDIQPYIKLLSKDYSKVNFVICPRLTNDDNLTSYFNDRELKHANNLFISESEFIKSMSIEYFTTHMIVDSVGKVKLWIPRLPSDVAFPLLTKYLSALEKEKE